MALNGTFWAVLRRRLVDPAGLEPAAISENPPQDSKKYSSGAQIRAQDEDDPEPLDPDFVKLFCAWQSLPDHLKQAILLIIRQGG